MVTYSLTSATFVFTNMCLFLIGRPVANQQREVESYATKLDAVRGNFQIAMVVHLTSDIAKSCEFLGDILVISER